jgi:hypothetical protein
VRRLLLRLLRGVRTLTLVTGALRLVLLLLHDLLAGRGLLLPSSARTLSTTSVVSVLMWFFTSTPSFFASCWMTSLDMPRSLATS